MSLWAEQHAHYCSILDFFPRPASKETKVLNWPKTQQNFCKDFWFGLFLEARADILTKISLGYWSIWRHKKDISKLTAHKREVRAYFPDVYTMPIALQRLIGHSTLTICCRGHAGHCVIKLHFWSFRTANYLLIYVLCTSFEPEIDLIILKM